MGAAQMHIHHMVVQKDTLAIFGQFSKEVGVVVIDGKPVSATSWSDSVIRISPVKGYEIRVAYATDTSNPRWITTWDFGARYERDYLPNPHGWQSVDIPLTEKGDISSYLLEPDMVLPARFGSLTIYPGDRYECHRPKGYLQPELNILFDDGSLLKPVAPFEIEVKDDPWFKVQNVTGGIFQSNAPPESVLAQAAFISNRRPFSEHIALPEQPLIFTWQPILPAIPYQLQIRHDDSLIVDTLLLTAGYALDQLQSQASYSWRLRFANENDTIGWLAWRTFFTDKLDKVQPSFKREASPYARTVTVIDSSQYASGIRSIEVHANNENEARVIPGRLIHGDCEHTRVVSIEQLDTTVTIYYRISATDCDDNLSSLYDSIPAHPYNGPSTVDADGYQLDTIRYDVDMHFEGRNVQLFSKQEGEIVIYDLLGRVVARYKLARGVSEQYLWDVPFGCYFVSAIVNDRRTTVRVILD